MNPRIYVIAPNRTSIKAVLKRTKDLHRQWSYLGNNFSRRRHLESLFSPHGIFIAIGPKYLARASYRWRQPYIDYIGRLGQSALNQEWGVSELAEKNTRISLVFLQLCYLDAAKQIIEEVTRNPDESLCWILIVESSALRRTLHQQFSLNPKIAVFSSKMEQLGFIGRSFLALVIRRVYFIGINLWRTLWAKCVYGLDDHLIAKLKKPLSTKITLVQHWIDQRVYDKKTGLLRRFPDFAPIEDYLSRLGEEIVVFPFILKSVPYIDLLRKIKKNAVYNFALPHAFLSFADIFKVAAKNLFSFPLKEDYPALDSFDLSEIIWEDKWREWSNQRQCENWLLWFMVAGFKRRNLSVNKIIYTYENHGWERVLCLAVRHFYPNCKLIAYEPPAVHPLHLNQFVSVSENTKAPLPDKIVAFGSYSAQLLIQSGHHKERIISGGTFRYHRIAETFRDDHLPTILQDQRQKVLVALDINLDESAELTWKVCQAFRDDTQTDIYLKYHPSLPAHKVLKVLGTRSLPKNFTMVDTEIKNLLSCANWLIYGFSGVSLAALGYPIHLLHVSFDALLEWDPLEASPTLRFCAATPEEINRIVRKPQERTIDWQKRRQFLEQFLGRSDESFLRCFL